MTLVIFSYDNLADATTKKVTLSNVKFYVREPRRMIDFLFLLLLFCFKWQSTGEEMNIGHHSVPLKRDLETKNYFVAPTQLLQPYSLSNRLLREN